MQSTILAEASSPSREKMVTLVCRRDRDPQVAKSCTLGHYGPSMTPDTDVSTWVTTTDHSFSNTIFPNRWKILRKQQGHGLYFALTGHEDVRAVQPKGLDETWQMHIRKV